MEKNKKHVINELAEQMESVDKEEIIYRLNVNDVLNVIAETLSDEEIQSLTPEKLEEIVLHIKHFNGPRWKEAIQLGIQIALAILKNNNKK